MGMGMLMAVTLICLPFATGQAYAADVVDPGEGGGNTRLTDRLF